MTLVLTVVRPGEGAWQSSDCRVTRGGHLVNDLTAKQLHIRSSDGAVLLAVAGLGSIYPGNTKIVDWIRETLRGEARTVAQQLEVLRERLVRDVSGSPWWQQKLLLHGVAFLGTAGAFAAESERRSGTPWVFEVTNVVPASTGFTTARNFLLRARRVEKPEYFVGGAIASVRGKEHALLRTTLRASPRRPDDYQGLLAAVTRRTAAHEATVSAWCNSAFLPQTGGPVGGRFWRQRGNLSQDAELTPVIVGPIDLTDVGRAMQARFLQGLRGATSPIDEAALERAARRAVSPRL